MTWFGWVTWGFSSSPLTIFIQTFQKLVKKNETIWFPIVSRIWKILTSLLKSLLTYKLRQNIWNKVEKSSKIGQHKKILISTFQCFLNVIGKICLEEILDITSRVFWIVERGGGWGLEILMEQLEPFSKLKAAFCEYLTSIKIKINMTKVSKEYEIKTKMEQEQWLLLKKLFLLGYNLKIYVMGGGENWFLVGEGWANFWLVGRGLPPSPRRENPDLYSSLRFF